VTVQAPPLFVRAHPATLEHALSNLIGNALKFVREGVPPEVLIRAEAQRGRVRIEVADNGIGIAREYQDRIFRVFERLHSEGEYPGTGIGLAIVKKGIERMDGQAGLESVLGQGSRFWIELPEDAGPAQPPGSGAQH
jgi:signal transduction histidine kinase